MTVTLLFCLVRSQKPYFLYDILLSIVEKYFFYKLVSFLVEIAQNHEMCRELVSILLVLLDEAEQFPSLYISHGTLMTLSTALTTTLYF